MTGTLPDTQEGGGGRASQDERTWAGDLAWYVRSVELHPDLEPLAFLLGTWAGEGEGDYPTTEPFRFREELTFDHVGEAFVLYGQRSWLLPGGEPLHFERGVLRPAGPGRLELALAHPIGLTEVSEGTLRGTGMDLSSTSIARTATGSPVTSLSRRYRVDGDVLSYEIDMATETTPSSFHVRAALRRG